MDQQNKKLILVEDDTFIRELFQGELERNGFIVKAFEKGEGVIQTLQSDHYDLVLLDIMLPDTNGLEILKEIKSNTNIKDIKVVLLTNLGQDTVIKEGFDLGAEGYLVKSAYNPDQIVNEVRSFLGLNAQS